MLSVAIETMIEEMRSLVMKTALMRPHARPTAPAIAKIANQPSPWLSANDRATYCATEAVAVKDMSMPPAISTTSKTRGENADERVRGQQIEQVLQGEEAIGRERERGRQDENDREQPEFMAAAERPQHARAARQKGGDCSSPLSGHGSLEVGALSDRCAAAGRRGTLNRRPSGITPSPSRIDRVPQFRLARRMADSHSPTIRPWRMISTRWAW